MATSAPSAMATRPTGAAVTGGPRRGPRASLNRTACRRRMRDGPGRGTIGSAPDGTRRSPRPRWIDPAKEPLVNLASSGSDPRYGHRTVRATVTLSGPGGAPMPRRDVTVRQTRHAFAFGNIGFDLIGYAKVVKDTKQIPANSLSKIATKHQVAATQFE